MRTKTRNPSRLTKALLETAGDMCGAGFMDAAAHEKITLRRLGGQAGAGIEPISGEEIRLLRKQAHLSQAVFARHLNRTTGDVSQLERGATRATGPALLNVIRRKRIEAIL
jgi:putative transcriptional regulator